LNCGDDRGALRATRKFELFAINSQAGEPTRKR
jgi:hypothetical protein